jgi:hypothetical protein
VKRLLRQFYTLARKEIQVLVVSDEHPNVVRCFAMEEDREFVYLALERCKHSLSDTLASREGQQDMQVSAVKGRRQDSGGRRKSLTSCSRLQLTALVACCHLFHQLHTLRMLLPHRPFIKLVCLLRPVPTQTCRMRVALQHLGACPCWPILLPGWLHCTSGRSCTATSSRTTCCSLRRAVPS